MSVSLGKHVTLTKPDDFGKLLEDEGIFFYFKHADDRHTLIVADISGQTDPCPGMSELRFMHEAISADTAL